MSFKLVHFSIFINVMNVFIDASSQHCSMGFLKKESLQVIMDAPRDSRLDNSFIFTPKTTRSVPINESGLLVKFFIAAKFDGTIPSGWPVLQIRRRFHANNSSILVFSTAAMEPRPTGYLNVFEYDVQNDVQHDDVIQVFWPRDTNVLSRYSLAYFRDSSNVMLSIKINGSTSTPVPEPQTTMCVTEFTTQKVAISEVTAVMMSSIIDINGFTSRSVSLGESQTTSVSLNGITDTPVVTKVPDTFQKAQTQVAAVIGGVLCTLALAVILLVVLTITVFVMLRRRNHTKDFLPSMASTDGPKSSAPVIDNPTYSLDGEFYHNSYIYISYSHAYYILLYLLPKYRSKFLFNFHSYRHRI